jgi:MFS family permease
VIATAVILVATWGGTEYSWVSAPVLGLIAVAVIAFAWFLSAERRAAEPMLPLHVFKSRNFSLTMALAFFVGLALFGALTFLPLYQQTVQGATPTVSGLLLTPMMVSSAGISVLAGIVVSKTGKYKLFPIVGGAVMAIAMYLLTGLSVTTSRWELGVDFVVLGLGMGCLMQMVSLIAQNSVELRDMGVATSARMFFQQMGGSLGVAAFGAVFASRLNSVMASAGSAGAKFHVTGTFDPAQVSSLPHAVQEIVFRAVTHGVDAVFLAVLPASVVVFALALFIKQVPLRGRAPSENAAPAPEAEALIG